MKQQKEKPIMTLTIPLASAKEHAAYAAFAAEGAWQTERLRYYLVQEAVT